MTHHPRRKGQGVGMVEPCGRPTSSVQSPEIPSILPKNNLTSKTWQERWKEDVGRGPYNSSRTKSSR